MPDAVPFPLSLAATFSAIKAEILAIDGECRDAATHIVKVKWRLAELSSLVADAERLATAKPRIAAVGPRPLNAFIEGERVRSINPSDRLAGQSGTVKSPGISFWIATIDLESGERVCVADPSHWTADPVHQPDDAPMSDADIAFAEERAVEAGGNLLKQVFGDASAKLPTNFVHMSIVSSTEDAARIAWLESRAKALENNADVEAAVSRVFRGAKAAMNEAEK
jgi:hypothetical protein